MIIQLPEKIAALPTDLRAICEQIFFVERLAGQVVPPETMIAWIERQFGDSAGVRSQTIIKITNRLTLESTLINPLRARRPSGNNGGDPALEEVIRRELELYDGFATPLSDTPADVFGRIRGKFCVSSSNIAKYEGWHGLVIFDEPHPLRFDSEQVRDYFAVALRWLLTAHSHDPQAIYPIITWNCLPKSGATIIHGHMQIGLARGMHYARVENWRRAAYSYRVTTGRDYFADLGALHQALDLAVVVDEGLCGFAHLTPMRNREIVLLAEPPLLRHRDGEIGRLGSHLSLSLAPAPCLPISVSRVVDAIAVLLRRLIESQGMRTFNLALALPPLGPAIEDWSNMPILVRFGDRGDPLSSRNDWGAMELFASGCTTADPFEVAAALRADDKGIG